MLNQPSNLDMYVLVKCLSAKCWWWFHDMFSLTLIYMSSWKLFKYKVHWFTIMCAVYLQTELWHFCVKCYQIYHILMEQMCIWLQFGIDCRENVPMAEWCEIPAGGCVPFWPTSTDTNKLMAARISGTLLESKPFDIAETHTTFLQIYHEVCLTVLVSASLWIFQVVLSLILS